MRLLYIALTLATTALSNPNPANVTCSLEWCPHYCPAFFTHHHTIQDASCIGHNYHASCYIQRRWLAGQWH